MNLRTFRLVALIEGTTFLALLVASIVKRVADQPVGVEILGPIHGVAFLAYVGMVFIFRSELRWNWKTTGLALVLSMIPFGGFWVERNLILDIPTAEQIPAS